MEWIIVLLIISLLLNLYFVFSSRKIIKENQEHEDSYFDFCSLSNSLKYSQEKNTELSERIKAKDKKINSLYAIISRRNKRIEKLLSSNAKHNERTKIKKSSKNGGKAKACR